MASIGLKVFTKIAVVIKNVPINVNFIKPEIIIFKN